MECPICKSRLMIKEAYNTAVNDNSPDTPTELYHVSEIACMNDKCDQYGVVKDTIKNKLEMR
jgi:hypothetical protein